MKIVFLIVMLHMHIPIGGAGSSLNLPGINCVLGGSRCPFIIRHACLLQRQANLGHHVFIGYRQKQICILPEKQKLTNL